MSNFNESQHPRNPAGTGRGGQFSEKHNSAPEAGLTGSVCKISESGTEYWYKSDNPQVLHRVDGPAIVAPGRLPHYRRENLPTDSAGRPLVWGPEAFGPETWRQLQDDQDLYDAYTIGARAVSEGSDEVTGEYLFDLKGDGKRAEEIWATYQMGAEAQRDMMLNQWRNSHQ